MKLKQSSYSSFSTPELAQKLLTLLAWMLLFGFVIAALIYLKAQLDDTVSRQRVQMNNGLYSGRIYLVRHELLLVHLSRTASDLYNDVLPATRLNDPLMRDHRVRIALSPSSRWSIVISGRDIQEISAAGAGLIYVAPETPFTVSNLYGRVNHAHAVPTHVLEQLIDNQLSWGDYNIRWLSDPDDSLSRIYLFTRVSPFTNAGWIGFELSGIQTAAELSGNGQHQFLLYDQDHKLALASDLDNKINSPDFFRSWGTDSFGYGGKDWVPSHLYLSKQIPVSQWTLVYYQNLAPLLNALWRPLIFCGLFCLLGGLLIWWGVRHVNQRWIAPSYRHLHTLVENEAFARALIQYAPVGLCALEKQSHHLLLKNEKTTKWLPALKSENWLAKIVAADSPGEEISIAGRTLQTDVAQFQCNGKDVLLASLSDITPLKQNEHALIAAKQAAVMASKAKTIFLATMSHEIRTPLYGVLGTLELLSLTQLNAQQKSYLQAIQRSSTALHQLINDVLDISKIEAGQLVLDPIEFNPLDLIQDAVYSYSAAARRKGIQLYACCDASLPYHVKGDAARIRQILNNLLSNAIKFTDSGRVVIRVKVENRDGERINLSWQVTDTGIGINAEDQKYLFDPFYQTRGQHSSTGGTGLGLSICLRLTQLMNGELRVISEKGLGSSFTLLLPLELICQEPERDPSITLKSEPVYVRSSVSELAETIAGWLIRWGTHAQVTTQDSLVVNNNAVLLELQPDGSSQAVWQGPHVVATEEAYSEPQRVNGIWQVSLHNLYAIGRAVHLAQGGIEQPENMTGSLSAQHPLELRILVAEDNPINQLVLKEQLESLGCIVALASDGVEALALWQPDAFDVVLTDINMPRMNGCELAQNLRERGCEIPIIGTTANAIQEESERCMKAGMNFCLVKPVGLSSLFSSLSAFETGN